MVRQIVRLRGGIGSGRCRSPLTHIDRVTSQPLRRDEYDHPGSRIHVDVDKFGNIPDGGGHRFGGRQQGDRKPATPQLPKARTTTRTPA